MNDEISGLPTRRAALRLLDAVMRMGTPMDQATAGATKGLSPPDRALAIAIAQETLRWSVDLDVLIDSKTKQPLPDDAKARMVLRLALAQILRLGTPAHAAIATALPLVDGGPRTAGARCAGFAVARRGEACPNCRRLPDAVMMRWHPAWGDDDDCWCAGSIGRTTAARSCLARSRRDRRMGGTLRRRQPDARPYPPAARHGG